MFTHHEINDSATLTEKPNYWSAADGGTWVRILILTGSCAGQEGWQLVDDDGDFVGLFDDDGDNMGQGNATWKYIRSATGPAWL